MHLVSKIANHDPADRLDQFGLVSAKRNGVFTRSAPVNAALHGRRGIVT